MIDYIGTKGILKYNIFPHCVEHRSRRVGQSSIRGSMTGTEVVVRAERVQEVTRAAWDGSRRLNIQATRTLFRRRDLFPRDMRIG